LGEKLMLCGKGGRGRGVVLCGGGGGGGGGVDFAVTT
jgi:hypothetical protein